ncbi:tripartite tricarboxylate transporter substrate binding protein [Variovorax sp. PBS-H4]|uniref:tripartite tricarboxylate transporter substrate binding protein n=1 Tax=Variovorax sp. PBS-H4 TaxID=434008 RepID=UPI001E457346|nr:tripartite tricarboxylate transporter substrate binding protein [Variovorax sp. PBS-H4]
MAAWAQTWPAKQPLRIVVPYSPGGATDAVARLVGQRLGDILGQSVIVDNRPGGNSNIGMQHVARAEPDGYTLGLVANSLATNNALFAGLPFDGRKDFAPIVLIASAPQLVAVAADSPIASLTALLGKAKAAPGELTYGSPGSGSSAHLAGEALRQLAGIDVRHIPYKGAAPALTDMIGGRISYMPMNTAEAMGHIRGKRVRVLAIAAAQRFPQLPDVPTSAEAGLPGYVESVWFGFAYPAGTPVEIVDRMNAAVNQALKDPVTKQRLTDLGAVPAGGSADEFTRFIASERARIERLVSVANIKAE